MIDTKALVNDYERVCEQLSIKKVSKETLNELKKPRYFLQNLQARA